MILGACHASATVEHTMPVANLQSYRTVALRVHASAFASQGQAMFLEQATLTKLQGKCGFDQIMKAGTPADVTLDLDITAMGRGGGGFITNPNLATVDTLLVLTDGKDGELLGTARIHGKSSGMIMNNAPPENEAIDVVAQTIVDLLAKSGCSGPRIARALATPPPNPTTKPPGLTTPHPIDESHRTAAEELNQQGKEKLYGNDIPGALALFQQAVALVPDARYAFNACLALGAEEQWDNAVIACRQARGFDPQPELAEKIDHRIDLLQHHQ